MPALIFTAPQHEPHIAPIAIPFARFAVSQQRSFFRNNDSGDTVGGEPAFARLEQVLSLRLRKGAQADK